VYSNFISRSLLDVLKETNAHSQPTDDSQAKRTNY
jgi:hypothetical protein